MTSCSMLYCQRKDPSMEKTRNEKILIGLSLFITVVIVVGTLTSDTDTEAPAEKKTQVRTSNKAPASTPETTSTPKPPTLSEKDQVKKLVTDQLKGQNTMKKDNLKSLQVTEQEGGGWNIEVGFNADDNLSMSLIKTGIERQMSKLYIALFNSDKDIRTVSISAYFSLEDQYGNVNDRVVYASTLNNEEARKVNWNANITSLELSILPRVWTTTMLHPEFNK